MSCPDCASLAERVRELEEALTGMIEKWGKAIDGWNPVSPALGRAREAMAKVHTASVANPGGRNDVTYVNPPSTSTAQARSYVDVLEELVGLMEGVIAGDYKPDSFTLQPAYEALGWKRVENDDCPSCDGGGFVDYTRCHCALREVTTQVCKRCDGKKHVVIKAPNHCRVIDCPDCVASNDKRETK